MTKHYVPEAASDSWGLQPQVDKGGVISLEHSGDEETPTSEPAPETAPDPTPETTPEPTPPPPPPTEPQRGGGGNGW